MKERKYEVGSKINDWVIVAFLKRNGCNKKIICYNKRTGQFKEGWIWDFTRGLINTKPNVSPMCKLCQMSFSDCSKKELYDINATCVYKQKGKTIDSDVLVTLRNIREGAICYEDLKEVLQIFCELLRSSGQHRRNTGLATVIGTTYEILNRKGY